MGLRSLGSTSCLVNTTWPLTPTSHLMQPTVTTSFWFWVEHTEIYEENWSEEQYCSKKKRFKEFATAFNIKDLEALYQEFDWSISYILTFRSQDTHCAKVLDVPSQLKMATRTKKSFSSQNGGRRSCALLTFWSHEEKSADVPPAFKVIFYEIFRKYKQPFY